MNSNKIQKGLGRGLSSLIGETKSDVNKNQLLILSIQLILALYTVRLMFISPIHPSQPYRHLKM